MRKNIKYQKGFTLIELLVVVVIIGVLSSLLMVNFVGIRQRARDAQRKADLRQIQSALEMYRADNGLYPIGYFYSNDANIWASFKNTININNTTYINNLPVDPLNDCCGPGTCADRHTYFYYSGDGSTYCLMDALESGNPSDPNYDGNCGNNNGKTCNSAFWANYSLGPP